ncbi:MAG: DUF3987 domain-containing protein [Betaproteobacteria bacterium]|nr:DUF3987 domain-containing protein [Betaproteobacteria bacterium]
MSDTGIQFAEAIRAAGLKPPDKIEADKSYRFPGIGKGNGNKAGWCKLFADGLGGCFGDFAADFSENWQAKRDKPFSPEEREAFKRHSAEAKAQAEAERKAKQGEAASKAVAIWQAAQPAAADHAYLIRKGIKAHGARLHNDALVIPMRDGGELHSLQFIGAGGDKRFLTGGRVAGCYYSIGTTKGAAALCIAEGFATGATIHEATGYPVAVAFDARNLEPVARALRAKFPDLALILCADDDAAIKGNPGLTKATAAARSVGGLMAIPDFTPEELAAYQAKHGKPPSDFNDVHQIRGLEAVARAVSGVIESAREAQQPDAGNAPAGDLGGWPAPQPLLAKVTPELYPIDALPDTIRAAAEEVAAFVKAPFPLVASSALAALSLAAQAHADVRRDEILFGPVGLFLLTIADSGERKTQADKMFTKPIQDYQDAQVEAAKPKLKDHRAAMQSWEAKRGGMKDKIRLLAKQGNATSVKEAELRNLGDAPEPPRVPKLIREDATPEGLAKKLQKEWPSAGVVSNEAGIVFGAHGMSKESVMRNLALLNKLWDGGRYQSDRGDEERSRDVRGARLTMGLMIQESTLRAFFEQSKGLARGTGFLSRFLVAWPGSTMGTRFYTPPVAGSPALSAFNRRITELLNQPVPIDDDGILTPPMLILTPEATAAWIRYHDAIEAELAGGGELYDVRDVASKSADNAARLAALFQIFEGAGGAIGADAFEGASRIAAWHLHESRRFFGELALPVELANAARLDSWLIEYCRRERTHLVPKNRARQHGPVRDGKRLDEAIRELESVDRVRLIQEGKRRIVKVNPALVIEGGSS